MAYAGKRVGVLVRTAKEMRQVYYGGNMARSKLKIPAANAGTARNMNAIAKLAELAAS